MKAFNKSLILLIIFKLSTDLIQSSVGEILIDHVKKSIDNANSHKSKLSDQILGIDGMSSAKVRHFLNNICQLPGGCYLEVGVFRGSTFISALYENSNNLIDAIAIDNWSEFGQNRSIFTSNISLYLANSSFRLFDKDCFSLELDKNFKNPINIYFYDGDHSVDAQKKAFTKFNPIFADYFIAIIVFPIEIIGGMACTLR